LEFNVPFQHKYGYIRDEQSQLIAILVPKLVAMATTLRHSISAMSSSDNLTPKTHSYNQTTSC